jgi:hypothetical protein
MQTRKKVILILIELGLWTVFILMMLWLWDHWLIQGPHGTIHWVGRDFVPYWVGVRAMLTGQSPYSIGTTHLIQTILLGGPPEGGGDPMLFVYPAWLFLLLVPLALIPLKWAVALWTGSLLLGIFHLVIYLAIRWGNQRLGWTGFWAAILVAGTLPYLSIAVTKGQLSLVSLGALFLSIRMVGSLPVKSDRRIPTSNLGETKSARAIFHESVAGIFLALAILKPTLTLIPMAGILLWALVERRFYYIGGFTSFIGGLSLTSWLAVGNWIPDYLQLLKSTGGAPVLWSLALLAWPWKVLYAFLFIGIAVYASIKFLRSRKRTQWFSAAILAGLALFPMRWIYDLLLGILIPAEEEKLSHLSSVCIVIALLAPWVLAIFPEPWRWSAQVIGIPLSWAIAWFALFVHPLRCRKMK